MQIEKSSTARRRYRSGRDLALDGLRSLERGSREERFVNSIPRGLRLRPTAPGKAAGG